MIFRSASALLCFWFFCKREHANIANYNLKDGECYLLNISMLSGVIESVGSLPMYSLRTTGMAADKLKSQTGNSHALSSKSVIRKYM